MKKSAKKPTGSPRRGIVSWGLSDAKIRERMIYCASPDVHGAECVCLTVPRDRKRTKHGKPIDSDLSIDTTLDGEQCAALLRAIQSVWVAIADDAEQACEDAGKEFANQCAIEACLDAEMSELWKDDRGEVAQLVTKLLERHSLPDVLQYLGNAVKLI